MKFKDCFTESFLAKPKRDPWTPDAPIPKEFYKNGKLKKDQKYYDWVDSQKKISKS